MLSKDKLVHGGVVFMVAAVAAVLVNVGQFYLIQPKRGEILVVDTAGIMTAKQDWFTRELSKPGITDADRSNVLEQTRQFVTDLDRELSNMQQECQCVIYDKGAVVIGNYIEVTDDLKKKLRI